MIRPRWPASLSGQIALLIATVLFVAQAINFSLLLAARNSIRIGAAAGQSAARLIDASERLAAGRRLRPADAPWRVALLPANPLPAGAIGVRQVETGVQHELREASVPVGRVLSAVQPLDLGAIDRRLLRPAQLARMARIREQLVVVAELPGRGWLKVAVVWPGPDRGVIVQLIAQTLILYAMVLLPMLWLARRVTRPLHQLAASARAFRPGAGAERVEEQGPEDVRTVISAYNALAQRVETMLDEKDRMLGAIGHDLRTPLAALRVRIESVDDEEDRERMAEVIVEMTRTLEDIVSLARLGRPSEPMTEVDLGALVDAEVAQFLDLGHEVTAAESRRILVRLRPLLFRRALRNLLENAVKYAGSAEVLLSADADAIRIEVCDRGPGIPPDRLTNVFEPFVRLEESRNRETGGVGLGLALAKAIVEQAGGTLTLANRDGGGLTATIALSKESAVRKPGNQPHDGSFSRA